jgi:hypothetical protein
VIAVQECLNCAQSCTYCADACIADPSAVHLGMSTGAALNCADMASAVVRVLSRPTAYDGAVTEAVLRRAHRDLAARATRNTGSTPRTTKSA